MRKITSCILVLGILSFANRPAPFSAKEIKRSFGKIREHIYMSKFEVCNGDYKLFLAALSAENKNEFIAALPDTQVWQRFLGGKPLTGFYFSHPAYTNYPVVGVSYENALSYCKWMTDIYNNDAHRKFAKVIFRLPTKEEWVLAANGGDDKKQYPWGTGFLRNTRNMSLCSYKEDVVLIYDSTIKKYIAAPDAANSLRMKVTSPVKSFYPSSFGMYNMSGNVAEMISEKGIAKGGSYDDPAWMVTIASEKKYTGPTADIGFRVVMEVLEN